MAAQPLCHDAVRVCTVNMQTRSHLQVLPALNLLFMFIHVIPYSLGCGASCDSSDILA